MTKPRRPGSIRRWPGALCLLFPLFASAAQRPNLLLVIADDCTYTDLGVYGGQAKTPSRVRGIRRGGQRERDEKVAGHRADVEERRLLERQVELVQPIGRNLHAERRLRVVGRRRGLLRL